jgi:broad specificity phosphatase PhoE
MTKLWCVRHGHTIWNIEERYNGLTDIPLDSFGVQQAEVLSERLAQNAIAYQAIYSSHLQRARQTAGIINERQNLPVFEDQRLREIELGEWEGKTFREIDIQFPQEISERTTNAAYVRSPGGESALEVAQRMVDAANDIVRSFPEGDVIVVAHGVSLAALILTAQGKSLAEVYHSLPEHLEPVPVEWDLSRKIVER